MFVAARREPSVRPAHEGPRHAVSVAGSDLAARLRELGTSAGSLEEALEPMLQAILETTGAIAGALCLYDIAQQALRLAGEIGLSEEGCRKLRVMARRGEADSWSIPLHGMLNRRCYLIEHAAQNRFVPPLIPDATKIETVACLPIYSGETPLASLVLVTRAPRTLGERELHGIEAPVHEIGRLIETMRQRSLQPESQPPRSTSVPTIRAGVSGGATSGAPSAETPSLAAEIARVERERERVTAELETLRRDAHGQTEAHAAALEHLRTQLGAAEAGVAHEQRAREELEVHLAAALATGREELREALHAAREAERARAAALTEVAELRLHLERERQLQAFREPPGGDRIAEIDALDVRLTALSAEADRLRETQATIASERNRLAADLACMAAARAHLVEASKAALAETTTDLREARTHAWDVAARLVETEALLDASREESKCQIASLTMQLAALREELTVARATAVDAARIDARVVARQRVNDLRIVVRDLRGCADVIEGIPLTGAEPLREAAARFADIASTIDAEYGHPDP